MTVVVDASVIIKWLLNDPERESETEKATALMRQISSGSEAILQPIHWLLEVAAVLTRLSPNTAMSDVMMLQAMNLPVSDHPAIIARACKLAADTRQHVFDTAYHAVALETPSTTLVTADDRYWRAASNQGQIALLKDW